MNKFNQFINEFMQEAPAAAGEADQSRLSRVSRQSG
jgi:hypothetical protein